MSEWSERIQASFGATGPLTEGMLKRVQALPEGSVVRHEALAALYLGLARLEWRDADRARERDQRREDAQRRKRAKDSG